MNKKQEMYYFHKKKDSKYTRRIVQLRPIRNQCDLKRIFLIQITLLDAFSFFPHEFLIFDIKYLGNYISVKLKSYLSKRRLWN